MVRVTALTSPLLLGFDDLERALDKVAKAGTDGYPPYNIERIAANGDAPEKLRITLAVAGFSLLLVAFVLYPFFGRGPSDMAKNLPARATAPEIPTMRLRFMD